jgi:acyl carrier protein
MPNTAEPTAETIRQLIAGVLFVESSEIDDDQTFIELGLDSLIAVEFVAELRAAFNRPITVDEVYEAATVSALADRLSSTES